MIDFNWLRNNWLYLGGGAVAGYFLAKLLSSKQLRLNPDLPYDVLEVGDFSIYVYVKDTEIGSALLYPEGWSAIDFEENDLGFFVTSEEAAQAIYDIFATKKLEKETKEALTAKKETKKAEKKLEKAIEKAEEARKAAKKAEKKFEKAIKKEAKEKQEVAETERRLRPKPTLDEIILDMVKRSIKKGRWRKYSVGHPRFGERYRVSIPKEITAREIAKRLAPFRRQTVEQLRDMIIQRGQELARRGLLYARVVEREVPVSVTTVVKRKSLPGRRRFRREVFSPVVTSEIQRQIVVTFKSEGPHGERGLFGISPTAKPKKIRRKRRNLI